MYVSLKAEETIGQKHRTIFPVKEDSGDSYMIDGWVIQKDRADVFYEESEYNAIYQELLQRREEVRELMENQKAKQQDMKDMENHYLERIRELEAELAEAREAKKVPLPREVAEAIEDVKEISEDIDLLAWMIAQKQDEHDTAPLKLLKKRAYEHSFLDLVDALRYGYTIEEPQTFQTNRKLDRSEIVAIRKWYQGAVLREQDGTDPDGFAREAIEEVVLYLGGAELLKDLSGFCKTQLEREKTEECG